ncbi:MAG TPA: hypothetical protein VIQ98_06430 [Gemmatimonadales bacterium]
MRKPPDQQPAEPGNDRQKPVRETGAPVVPEELIKGDWRRRLVLPNQDGQLRLTPVKTVRGGRSAPSTQIRYLDDKRRRNSA